tara:strand:+ start:1021 stop:1215 length:195 start_codon:yes stop_codon:yes gene_type:complete
MASKKQYQAFVIGKVTLIGGRKEHFSVWFDTKKTAQDWLSVIKQGNREANRVVAKSGIKSRIRR